MTDKVEELKRSLILVSLLVTSIVGFGQFTQSGLLDIGSSTVSSGIYLRPASISRYDYKKFYGRTGFQWTFSDAERKTFSGWFLSGGGDFSLKEIPFTAELFYRVNPFSSLTKESNFGFILLHNRKHIDIHFGYHMRYYSLDGGSEYTDDLEAGADLRIWEYRNFIYRGTLRLNEVDAQWNAAISVSNYDHFLIQQETNPLFFLEGYYKISEAFKIKLECWYQGAGMLNLHPNHYGYYFRTGIEWQLGQ